VSAPADGRPGLAEELRRRRTALGWTLEQVAEQAQVSVGMLSLIETGKRRPSLRSWERIRGALGITEALPIEVLHQERREVTDGLVASLGACLAAVRQATLAELAEATGWPVSEVRLALRRLAEQLEPIGMQVIDDGSHVQLAVLRPWPTGRGALPLDVITFAEQRSSSRPGPPLVLSWSGLPAAVIRVDNCHPAGDQPPRLGLVPLPGCCQTASQQRRCQGVGRVEIDL
jgi:transcriptional regulator with XRE-family HTH domain